MQNDTQNGYGAPIAIIIAGIIIAGAVMYGTSRSSGDDSPTDGGTQPVKAMDINNIKTAGEPYIGNINAPLTMVAWEDYQCPFCERFEKTTLSILVTQYVNTGKLKIVFKDYAFLGNDSITAAEYEHAIWALYPDKLAAWRTAMFAAQDAEGDKGFGDSASIDTLVATIPGLNFQKIKDDIAAHKATYDTAIADDQQEGANLGIRGTPGFVIGTQVISGAQPTNVFTQLIDAELNK